MTLRGAAAARRGRLTRREAIEGWIGIMPWLIGFILFNLIPIISSLYLSFTDWDILTKARWIGLGNYDRMIHDRYFWISLRVTTVYTLMYLPLNLTVGLLLSLLLNVRTRWSHFFRTLYYLPSVISGVAVVLVWMWLLNPDFGLVNYVLRALGLPGPQWFFSQRWALPSLVLLGLWGVGNNVVIYLAGLQNIPPQLYEAAEIDGCGALGRFFRITLPLLSPTILFLLIMGVIWSFQVFTQAYVATGGLGGPNNATLFYLLYLYNEAFRGLRMGYGAALAWFLALVVLICSVLIFKTSNRWVHYEGGREQ
ncbi:MAG: carbohydrate ABC transporter permease [Patescibacteria group bacterium]